MNYEEKLAALLGPPLRRGNPEAWTSLERELRVGLPDDYKGFIEAYAPVRLNGHLHFDHPAHADWNLAQWITQTLETYRDLDWVDLSCPGFVSEAPRFGGPDQLIPLFGSDRGECFFFKPGDEPRIFVYVGSDDDFYQYDMEFAEWLYRYLQGEDMAGPNSSAYSPGPVRFDALPGASEGEAEYWFGPARPNRAE